MEELAIQTHSFEKSKNQLKKFSEQTITDLDLKKVDSDKGFGEFVGDLIFGRGVGLDHKVTGSEFNNLTSQVQEHLIAINDMQRSFIKEFGQVYNALEALDKDYIQSILIAVKAAQKANHEAKIAQGDIEKTIAEQKKIIKVLQQFKEKLDKYKHIEDIDKMWGELQTFHNDVLSYKKSIESLNQFRSQINAYEHIKDIDNIWKSSEVSKDKIEQLNLQIQQYITEIEKHDQLLVHICRKFEKYEGILHIEDIDSMYEEQLKLNKEVEQLKIENSTKESKIMELSTKIDENHELLNKTQNELLKKIKILYWLAGSSITLVVIQFILLNWR